MRATDDEGHDVDTLVDDENLTLDPAVIAAHVATNADGLYTNTTFVAKFKDASQRTFRITYAAEANGAVRTFAVDDEGHATVLDGPAATVVTPKMLCSSDAELVPGEAVADEGYTFVGWFLREEGPLGRPVDTLVTDAAQLDVATLTQVLPVDEAGYYVDATLTAKFKADTDATYTVTYTAGTGGSVDTAANADLMARSTKGVTGSVATAAPGYVFEGWYVRVVAADGTVVEVKNAWLDWMVPDTDIKVRMGLQGFFLPSMTTGSQVWGDDAAGITASWQINENVALTALWARLYNDNFQGYGDDGLRKNYMDNVDVAALLLPLTFDGFRLTPWAMYAGIGPNSLDADHANDWKSVGVSGIQYLAGMLPAGGASHNSRMDLYGNAFWAGPGENHHPAAQDEPLHRQRQLLPAQ